MNMFNAIKIALNNKNLLYWEALTINRSLM